MSLVTEKWDLNLARNDKYSICIHHLWSEGLSPFVRKRGLSVNWLMKLDRSSWSYRFPS